MILDKNIQIFEININSLAIKIIVHLLKKTKITLLSIKKIIIL